MMELVSNRGRRYISGIPLSIDYRNMVLKSLQEAGANAITGEVPRGKVTEVAQQTKVTRMTVMKIWKQFVKEGNINPAPRRHSGGIAQKLTDQDVLYIEMLKRERPSITLAEIQERLFLNANVRISTSRLCRYVKYKIGDKEWTRKKMCKLAVERFTEHNMAYTQAYLDFLTQCDPFNVKFMDETGIQMPAVGNRSYGHSPKGETCIELQRYAKSPNKTLNMLVGINGICYANVIQGPSNTDSFLQFFGEASNAAAPDGEPAIRPGDIIVVDNCPIHHHDGGRALAVFLDNMGVEYVFAPVYSPDINPVEYLFNDLKIRLKMYQYRDTLRRNTEFAVYHALSTIGAAECYGYYKHVGIFRL